MADHVILCGTDLGPSGARAVELAAAWAAGTRSRLEIIHVTEPLPELHLYRMPDEVRHAVEGMRHELLARQTEITQQLAAVEADCLARGLECRAKVLNGRPWERIVEEAREIGASGVVVGPHASGISLLGTTAARVLREADCPVFVAAGSGPIPATVGGRRWVAAVDFSPESVRAVVAAGRFVRAMEGDVLLVHALPASINDGAVEWSNILSDMKHDAENELRALAGSADLPPDAARVLVTRGLPAREILRVARTEQADFIAVGTHGRVGLSRALLGSVAEKVARSAPVPVLVARETGRPSRRSADPEAAREGARRGRWIHARARTRS